MTKLSVIIPYHNVEKYISKCLESVISQTLGDIEIICINDCSSDNSVKIVEDYALHDSRIIMLNTALMTGQAYARNLALDIAKGEYIGFVDSDDWIEPYMFEKMYNAAKACDSDITMCQAKLFDDKTSEIVQNDYYDLKCLEKFGDNVFCAEDTKDEILNINVVLWNKIYKREFLNQTGERFPNGYIYEDLPFFYATYLKALKVNIVWEHLYYYRQNREYSTMQNIDKKIYDRIPMVALALEKLKQADFYKEKQTLILSWIIDDIFHRYTLLDEKYYKEYFYMMKKLFRSFDLTPDEKLKLDTSYCYDEFCSILENHYFDFWKFLIEKYKTSNLLIKTIKHENNESIAAIKKYLTECELGWQQEKESINNHFEEQKLQYEKILEEKENEYNANLKLKDEEIKNLNSDWEDRFTREMFRQKQESENKYWDLHSRMVEQEYELKRWQAQSQREQKEKLTADFKWKLEKQKQHYTDVIRKQKEYYENNFLLVKISIKIQKLKSKFNNKIKRFLKKN